MVLILYIVCYFVLKLWFFKNLRSYTYSMCNRNEIQYTKFSKLLFILLEVCFFFYILFSMESETKWRKVNRQTKARETKQKGEKRRKKKLQTQHDEHASMHRSVSMILRISQANENEQHQQQQKTYVMIQSNKQTEFSVWQLGILSISMQCRFGLCSNCYVFILLRSLGERSYDKIFVNEEKKINWT